MRRAVEIVVGSKRSMGWDRYGHPDEGSARRVGAGHPDERIARKAVKRVNSHAHGGSRMDGEKRMQGIAGELDDLYGEMYEITTRMRREHTGILNGGDSRPLPGSETDAAYGDYSLAELVEFETAAENARHAVLTIADAHTKALRKCGVQTSTE